MPSDGTEARDLGDFAVEWAQELSRLVEAVSVPFYSSSGAAGRRPSSGPRGPAARR
jgi:hypothetical protein